MHRLTFVFACLLVMTFFSARSQPQNAFVQVRNGRLFQGDKPYFFMGTNFWYGMNLGAPAPLGNRERLIRELDRLQALGVTNLRVMAATEGPDTEPWRMAPAMQPSPGVFREDILEGLDFLLVEMGKRNMTAVMCMGNFWNWSGGFGQYLAWAGKGSIPYPPPAEGGDWTRYQLFASAFYKNKTAVDLYVNTLAKVISRTNTITGKPYTQDPTIMSWQLGNEPRGILNGFAFRKWIRKMSHEIKSLDANHLVTIGSEGRTSSSFAGNRFTKDHKSDDVDYTTAHLWVQNWGWYDPSKSETSLPEAIAKGQDYLRYHADLAQKINKPLVLEEFGISRDLNNHDPMATVQVRDAYYAAIFQEIYDLAKAGKPVAGVNFWAWGGEGRPRVPEGFWLAGDDFLGDPPHESQGWYSVYETDSTTQAVIRKFARMMNELR